MSAVETKQQSDSVRKHKEFLFPAVATYYQEPLALIKGEGFHVWDDKGDKYLDCFGGVLTVSVGHANPRVNDAIINQVNSISHTSTLYCNKPQSDLAEKLAQITPGRLKKSFFTNSGTEAVEGALKTARKFTERTRFVAFDGSFHGDTFGAFEILGRGIAAFPDHGRRRTIIGGHPLGRQRIFGFDRSLGPKLSRNAAVHPLPDPTEPV